MVPVRFVEKWGSGPQVGKNECGCLEHLYLQTPRAGKAKRKWIMERKQVVYSPL